MALMRRPLCVLTIAALFASCGSVDGSDPYALWDAFDDGSGSFHFHYLSPPWKRDEHQHHQVFVIVEGGPQARMQLEFAVMEQQDIDRAAEQLKQDGIDLGFEMNTPQPFLSAAGDPGQLVYGQKENHWFVAVVQKADDHRFGALTIVGELAPYAPDMQLLLRSLEPRRSDEE